MGPKITKRKPKSKFLHVIVGSQQRKPVLRVKTIVEGTADTSQQPSASANLAADEHIQDDLPASPPEAAFPTFSQRVRDAEDDWLMKESDLSLSLVSFHGMNTICDICSCAVANPLRCLSCHFLNVCEDCLVKQHHHNPPHVVEVWNGECFQQSADYKAVLSSRCTCGSSEHSFKDYQISLLTFTALTVSATVRVCNKCGATLLSTLLSHGYWPCSASLEAMKKPKAISLTLLMLQDAVAHECSASLYSICCAWAKHRDSLWLYQSKNMYRWLNDFGCVQAFRRVVRSIRWPGGLVPCPQCTLDPDSRKEEALFCICDGHFGTKHRASAGHDSLADIKKPPLYLDIDTQQKEKTPTTEVHCPNWSAGERGHRAVAPKAVSKMDVYGCFAASCRHGSVLSFSDMTTPGERLCYADQTVSRVLQNNKEVETVVIYDIACKISTRLAGGSLTKFAVPAMHAYGHSLSCQLTMGVRATDGAGLTDGESSERIWAQIRCFGPQLKEMGHRRRLDYMENLFDSLNFSNLRSVVSWPSSRFQLLDKTYKYISDALVELISENVIASKEELLEVRESWSEMLIEKSTRKLRKQPTGLSTTLMLLHTEASERDFLVEHLSTERGQSMQKHLRSALKASFSKSSDIIKKYNDQRTSWDDKLTLEDFRYVDSDGFRKFLSLPKKAHKIKAVHIANLILRCREELRLLNADIRRSLFFISSAIVESRDNLIPNPIEAQRISQLNDMKRALSDIYLSSQQRLCKV